MTARVVLRADNEISFFVIGAVDEFQVVLTWTHSEMTQRQHDKAEVEQAVADLRAVVDKDDLEDIKSKTDSLKEKN